jgi:hypothetical protein
LEINNNLVGIQDCLSLRDRIAHGLPIWHKGFILFTSYDGVYWNKLYNKIRQEKSDFYQDNYFKQQLKRKKLSENSFSYVIYHISTVEYLMDFIVKLKAKIKDA